MPEVFCELQSLALAIKARITPGSVVGVDGWTGVGKTHLAGQLAETLNGLQFDLDAALENDRGCYVDALRTEEIRKVASEPSSLLLLSGVCMREALQRAGVQADLHVYVKRMAGWGWADEDDVCAELPPAVGSNGGKRLREEMRTYHTTWLPQLTCDFEFHRYD
jgi:hypothetical protein